MKPMFSWIVRWQGLCIAAALSLAAIAMVYASSPSPASDPSPPQMDANQGTSESSSASRDEKAIFEQMVADEKRISIREANLFHYRLIDRCILILPDGVFCANQGVIVTDNGHRLGQRIVDEIGAPLRWDIYEPDALVICSFWISTKQTEQTLAKCSIEGRVIFLNVEHVNRNRSVDARLPELGGRSVRQVLSLIEDQGAPSEKTAKAA